jgi:membrane protein required for colicin V production
MNGFDIALVTLVALSALFAFARGIIREVIALAAWIVGFIAAIAYAGSVAGMFGWLDIAPVAKQAIAFGLILLVVLIAGALAARSLAGLIRALGLGFMDRILGLVFGVARGSSSSWCSRSSRGYRTAQAELVAEFGPRRAFGAGRAGA